MTEEIEALKQRYLNTRLATLELTSPLLPEDFVVQPADEVSPPKWHLGHSTWFFENFILNEFQNGYQVFHPAYSFIFNSYYESVGPRIAKQQRGFLSRPSFEEVLRYRRAIDYAMRDLMDELPSFESALQQEILRRVEIGIQHEQQHQELLLYDIKYILGQNPLYPPYDHVYTADRKLDPGSAGSVLIKEDLYAIGHSGKGFCYDNELPAHKIYLRETEIENSLVMNRDWLEFISDGAYSQPALWLSDGWDWVKSNRIHAPLYWQQQEDQWLTYYFSSCEEVDPEAPAMHISYYEAEAFARWQGKRLPSEAEWEVASALAGWPSCVLWQWTGSAYLPYPGYVAEEGPLGEYNGKFMINQMVLRGGSFASPYEHYRNTYRNFFLPQQRWMFSGLRLAKRL